jgi:hypothetical protein
MNEVCEPFVLNLAQWVKSCIGNLSPTTDLSSLTTVLDGFGYVIPHHIVVVRAVETALPR